MQLLLIGKSCLFGGILTVKRVFYCLTAVVLMLGFSACAAGAPEEPIATPETAASASEAPVGDGADTIVFSDPVLEGWIREALGKPEGDITAADALGVTELELSQQGVDPEQPYIHDLGALKYFTNLTYLGLGYAIQNVDDPAAPVDLSPLSALTKLESLQMGGVVIDDLSAVSGMQNLKSLSVFNGAQPLDLSPLTGLTNLSALTLRNNKVTDVSSLSGLSNLIYLDLEGNEITDVSPLAGLTNLKRLFLANNPIDDFSPLAGVRASLEEWDFEVQ